MFFLQKSNYHVNQDGEWVCLCPDSEEFTDLGWRKRSRTAYSQVCSQKKEVIWMNYTPPVEQMEIEDIAGGKL